MLQLPKQAIPYNEDENEMKLLDAFLESPACALAAYVLFVSRTWPKPQNASDIQRECLEAGFSMANQKTITPSTLRLYCNIIKLSKMVKEWYKAAECRMRDEIQLPDITKAEAMPVYLTYIEHIVSGLFYFGNRELGTRILKDTMKLSNRSIRCAWPIFQVPTTPEGLVLMLPRREAFVGDVFDGESIDLGPFDMELRDDVGK